MFKRGFTLLEVIVSVSILALIGTVALVSFVNSRNVRELVTSGQNVLSVLRLAQSKALSGEDASSWGVRLATSTYTLFRGTSYAGSTSTKVHLLPSSLEVINVGLAGGGPDVVFKRLDGATDQYGNFDLRIKGSADPKFSITVDSSGKVYTSSTPPITTGTRVTDSRHRNFDLGWSIDDAVSLILTFSDPPNPDTIYSVVMSPPPPRTVFDWTGTISVGGQNQTLRIHTLSISGGNTALSVDRDCRKNTKKMKVSVLDGDLITKDIATYEANCATLTTGPYGGTVSEP